MSINRTVAPWAPDVARLIEHLADQGIPADAIDIYRGRNRVVKLSREGRAINIKAFRVPNIVNRLVYTTLRKSKAARSYEYALRLRNLGFNTPEPLGFLEVLHGPLLAESYYLSQQLDGFREMRVIDEQDDPAMLADELGALMARMHSVGVWMKDFSQGNVLRRRVAKGHYEFFLVDINRMEFDVTDRRKLMSNFRAITDDPSFLRSLVRSYARHSRLPENQVIAEAAETREAFRRRGRTKKAIKRLLGLGQQ